MCLMLFFREFSVVSSSATLLLFVKRSSPCFRGLKLDRAETPGASWTIGGASIAIADESRGGRDSGLAVREMRRKQGGLR